MGSDTDGLLALAADPRFLALNRARPRLSLLRAAGVARDEVTHSRILAALCDPETHRGARPFLRELLGGLGSLGAALSAAAPPETARVLVHRELYRIDVLVELQNGNRGCVLAIENKIGAGEQPEQLARYQDAVARAYPQWPAVLVFLSPDGRTATTGRPDPLVPWVARGYEWVEAAVRAVLNGSADLGPDRAALTEFAAHLSEEVLGVSDVQHTAAALWREHRTALRHLVRERPRFASIVEAYRRQVTADLGPAVAFGVYPAKRGEPREVNFIPPGWAEAGYRFHVMFYSNGDDCPAVRVLLWSNDFDARADALRAWAVAVNGKAGAAPVDEAFRPLPGWTVWRRVFAEPDYPPAARVEAGYFDGDTATAAARKAVEQVRLLEPFILASPGG